MLVFYHKHFFWGRGCFSLLVSFILASHQGNKYSPGVYQFIQSFMFTWLYANICVCVSKDVQREF